MQGRGCKGAGFKWGRRVARARGVGCKGKGAGFKGEGRDVRARAQKQGVSVRVRKAGCKGAGSGV